MRLYLDSNKTRTNVHWWDHGQRIPAILRPESLESGFEHHPERPSRPGRSLWRRGLQASTNRHQPDLLPLPPNTQLPLRFLRQPI